MDQLLTTLFGPKCAFCHTRRTRKELDGKPICQTCRLEMQAAAEDDLVCPKCKTVMSKHIQQTVVYDKCPACGGVWLDKDELETLVNLAAATGQAGIAAGVMTAMLVTQNSRHC